MKKFAFGLSTAALLMAGAAIAAPQGGGRMNPDADGNGVVTRAEAQAQATAQFARMDANKDDQINQADHDLRRQERRTKMFDALDTNKDGSVTRAEYMAFKPEPRPAKDGKSAADAGSATDAKGPRDGKRHHMGKRGHRGGAMMMRGVDADNNGSISQAEFTAAAMRRFDAVDANKDGQITREERQAQREQMRGKWREAKQQQQQRDGS